MTKPPIDLLRLVHSPIPPTTLTPEVNRQVSWKTAPHTWLLSLQTHLQRTEVVGRRELYAVGLTVRCTPQLISRQAYVLRDPFPSCFARTDGLCNYGKRRDAAAVYEIVWKGEINSTCQKKCTAVVLLTVCSIVEVGESIAVYPLPILPYLVIVYPVLIQTICEQKPDGFSLRGLFQGLSPLPLGA